MIGINGREKRKAVIILLLTVQGGVCFSLNRRGDPFQFAENSYSTTILQHGYFIKNRLHHRHNNK